MQRTEIATDSLFEQLARRTLRGSVATSGALAIPLIVFGLAASWWVVYYFGGAAHMVPHWYYIPILFAVARFGMTGALVVALLAGVLAGPLTYHDVATGTPQETSEWLTRTGFFMGIGLLMSWMIKPSLRPITEELQSLREEFTIRRALSNGEFFLRYQPILSFQHGTFIGAEALIRWQHPTRGELSPAAFISVAEQSSLICDLSNFVIDEACRQAAEWRELALTQNKPAWHIAINLSARDLERTDLAHHIEQSLKKYELPAERLHIELTESVLLFDGAEFQIRHLKKLGVRLVVDDFGTGFSSLSYLHRFPVDILKIDRSLVADLTPEKPSQALANGMILLAKSLGMLTIAEGLESVEQLKIGKALEFDCVQGFYLAKPLNADAIPKLILSPAPVLSESSTQQTTI